MRDQTLGPCPYCGSQLEPGHLGFSSGLFWSRNRLNWWQSIFLFAFSYGEFVIGNLVSTPWFKDRSAHRCSSCRVLVIPTDKPVSHL